LLWRKSHTQQEAADRPPLARFVGRCRLRSSGSPRRSWCWCRLPWCLSRRALR